MKKNSSRKSLDPSLSGPLPPLPIGWVIVLICALVFGVVVGVQHGWVEGVIAALAVVDSRDTVAWPDRMRRP